MHDSFFQCHFITSIRLKIRFTRAQVSYNADSRTGVEDASTYGKIDSEINKDKGIYLGIEDEDNHESSTEEDGLEDVWNEMSMALELTKVSLQTAIATRQTSSSFSPIYFI